MITKLTIDEFSLTTVPILLHFNEQLLSTATPFIWQRGSKHYLITNWHNVSGRDPNTDKHHSPTAAEPNVLHGLFNTRGRTFAASTLASSASVRTRMT